MMPIPIIIPGSSSIDYSERRKVVLDINSSFDRIKHRLERVANLVYFPNKSFTTEDALWVDECGLNRKENRWFSGGCAKITFRVYVLLVIVGGMFMLTFGGMFMLLTFGGMFMSNQVIEFELLNEIWNTVFFWDGEDWLSSIFIFILYPILLPLISGTIYGKLRPTYTYIYKEMEVSEMPSNTIISFTLDDNEDYAFYRELLKEFKVKNRMELK